MSLDIDAIKARADAATPGPWEAKCIHVYMGGEGQYRVGPPNRPPSFQGVVSPSDAEFFAHAREDVPALVAEVERQDEVIRINHDGADYAEQLLEQARAEVARLAAANTHLIKNADALAEKLIDLQLRLDAAEGLPVSSVEEADTDG